jgi:threonine/homoserine/homoserine lactone efflux protein
MSIAFLLAAAVAVAVPGPGVVFTLSAGLARGSRAAVVAAFGCTLGMIPHMLATVTGLAALLHTSAVAFQMLKYLGVAYLLYTAWATVRDRDAIAVTAEPGTRPPSTPRVILAAVLLNLLNPKLTIFFVAFLPQFVPADDPHYLLRMLELSGVAMLLTFVGFTLYGVCAASVRRHILDRPAALTWLRRTFAATFVLLSTLLLLTDPAHAG